MRRGGGLVMGATLPALLRRFANGGSSLTGVEAVVNTVDVFRKLQGVNACRVLTAVATIFGLLPAGVAYLACVTHATIKSGDWPTPMIDPMYHVVDARAEGRI